MTPAGAAVASPGHAGSRGAPIQQHDLLPRHADEDQQPVVVALVHGDHDDVGTGQRPRLARPAPDVGVVDLRQICTARDLVSSQVVPGVLQLG